jgi:hypothetical protein
LVAVVEGHPKTSQAASEFRLDELCIPVEGIGLISPESTPGRRSLLPLAELVAKLASDFDLPWPSRAPLRVPGELADLPNPSVVFLALWCHKPS